jgi:hypothetical protein
MAEPNQPGFMQGFDPTGKTQSEIAAEQARRVQASKDAVGDKDDGEGPIRGWDKTFYNPGSADVGGSVGAGKDIADYFSAGQGLNDAQQASNSGAMAASLANMKGDRGQVSPENAGLVATEAQGRFEQGQALDIARDAAMGRAPSEAAAQTTLGMNDIMAGQAGAMGSARGLAGLGGVQNAGAAMGGLAAGNLAMQGGLGRSKEMGQALGMYGTQAGDMRAGDLGRVNQTNQNALHNQSLNDDWKIGNANLAARQGQLGVSQGQMDDAYYGASLEPAKRQFGYDQEMKAIEAGQNSDAAGARRAASNATADRNRQLAGGAAAGGLTIIGGAMGGPAGAVAGGTAGGMANSYINKR